MLDWRRFYASAKVKSAYGDFTRPFAFAIGLYSVRVRTTLHTRHAYKIFFLVDAKHPHYFVYNDPCIY